MGRGVAGRGEGAAGGSGGVGFVAVRSWVAWADRGAFSAGGVGVARAVLSDGRPTIAMETFVRLMVLKARYRWGYRTLVAEVSDSIHLRRFCRISLSERVPDESTVRKLTRRLGSETVAELTRVLIARATREKRFRARAVRIDSTVIEADVKYPTDAGLAAHGVRALAREATQAREAHRRAEAAGAGSLAVDGSPLRGITRTIRRRTGEAKAEVLRLTGADRRAVGALGHRGAAAGGHRQAQGARAWREGEAEGGREAGGAGGSLREGRRADQAARRGRADQGSDDLARQTRTPGRSARASSASRTSSGMSPSWRR